MAEPLNRFIDHAILKPEMTRDEALQHIRQGLAYHVACICVRPCDIDLVVGACRGTDTAPGVVLGFPCGTNLSITKAAEARQYVDRGAAEIDMVANYGLIRSGLWDAVRQDIEAVSAVTRPSHVLLKVILETCTLTDDQIALATQTVADAGADFAKTSTGFAAAGATEQAVKIMVQAAAGRVQIKAAGGIRDAAQARRFLDLGCTRLGVGSSSTAAVLGQGASPTTEKY